MIVCVDVHWRKTELRKLRWVGETVEQAMAACEDHVYGLMERNGQGKLSLDLVIFEPGLEPCDPPRIQYLTSTYRLGNSGANAAGGRD